MTRFGPLLALALLACGPADEGGATLALALSQDLLDRTTELQIAFIRPGSLDCAQARAACAKDAGLTIEPVVGATPARPVLSVPFDRKAALGAGQRLRADIRAGTWLLLVEALDTDGQLIANGCRLKIDIRAGATEEVALSLGAYDGPACVARFE